MESAQIGAGRSPPIVAPSAPGARATDRHAAMQGRVSHPEPVVAHGPWLSVSGAFDLWRRLPAARLLEGANHSSRPPLMESASFAARRWQLVVRLPPLTRQRGRCIDGIAPCGARDHAAGLGAVRSRASAARSSTLVVHGSSLQSRQPPRHADTPCAASTVQDRAHDSAHIPHSRPADTAPCRAALASRSSRDAPSWRIPVPRDLGSVTPRRTSTQPRAPHTQRTSAHPDDHAPPTRAMRAPTRNRFRHSPRAPAGPARHTALRTPPRAECPPTRAPLYRRLNARSRSASANRTLVGRPCTHV